MTKVQQHLDMKYNIFIVLFFSIVLLKLSRCAPGAPACLAQDCDSDSGPVCGIDASGLPRTFENKCHAMLAYCRFGSYFVEVKPGEC